MMILDSHVLLWWIEGGAGLSSKATDLLSVIGSGKETFLVSPVTFWELRYKEVRGQLVPRRPVAEWMPELEKTGDVKLAEPDLDVWLLAASLPWENRDPADRLIAATALRRGVPVMTKDRRFHESSSPVKAVW